MIVRTPTPGWDAEIYARRPARRELVSDWGEPVGDRQPTAASQRDDRRCRGKPANYFLIWFTKAAAAPRTTTGRYQVEISDVELLRAEPAPRTRRSGRCSWRSTASSTRRSQRSG